MNENVRFIRANLEQEDFDDIPSHPHYRLFKKNKRVDHVDGAYKEVLREKVEKHGK